MSPAVPRANCYVLDKTSVIPIASVSSLDPAAPPLRPALPWPAEFDSTQPLRPPRFTDDPMVMAALPSTLCLDANGLVDSDDNWTFMP